MSMNVARKALPLTAGAAALALMATVALAATGIARVLTATGGAGGDFLSFYAAGRLVRTDAASLYDVAAQAAAQRSLYPGALEQATGYPLPVIAAWGFAPLSALPFAAAFALWTGVNVTLLAAIARTLARELRGVPAWPRRAFVAVFVTSMPVVANIVFGQVDFIIFAALLGGWLLLRSGRPGWAGVALAAAVIKPQFLVGIVPMLVVGRQWRALVALSGTGAAVLIVPALLTDPGTLGGNVRLITSYPGAGDNLQVNASMMSNWRGFVVSVTGNDAPWLWAPSLAAIAAAALTVAVPRWRALTAQGYALAVVLPLVASPHLHTQSLVLLFVAVALALRAWYEGAAADEGRDRGVTSMLLALHAALFALWLSTALGFAPLVFLVAAVYAGCAWRWPRASASASAQLQRAA